MLWSVWERTFTKDGTESSPKQRWIQCDLLRYQQDAWGYKDMEESMGPYYFSCPLKYLGMVPLDVHGGDASWREQVIDHHRRSEEKRYAPQGVGRIEKSETVHDDGYYRVGPVCIYPDERKERRQCSDLTVSESDR